MLLTGPPFLNGTRNSLRRAGLIGIVNSGESGGGSPYSCSLCNLRSVSVLLVTTFEPHVTLAWGMCNGDDSKGILSLAQATCGEIVLGEFIGLLLKRGLRPPCLTPVWGVSPEADEVLLPETILGNGDVHPRSSVDTLSSHAAANAPKS